MYRLQNIPEWVAVTVWFCLCLFLSHVCRDRWESSCNFLKATWLFRDLRVRWTFRWHLHGVHWQKTASNTSLLWYVHWWRQMDGLFQNIFKCKHVSVIRDVNLYVYCATLVLVADLQCFPVSEVWRNTDYSIEIAYYIMQNL